MKNGTTGHVRIIRIPFVEYREDNRPIFDEDMQTIEREAREELACALDAGYEVAAQFTVQQRKHLTLVLVMYLHPALMDGNKEKCLSEVNGHGGE